MSEREDAQAPSSGGGANGEASELLALASGVARVAALAWWHVAGWTASAAVAGTTYVAKRAAEGQSTPAILQDAAGDLRSFARRALGVDGDARVVDAVRPASREDVRRTGAELIRRSSDVRAAEEIHPAFARILAEITPDEARVLRLLMRDGPQPSVDVRTRRTLGASGQLAASGLNMIAEQAGCAHPGHGRLYLANLARLGLIEFCAERVVDPDRYQVVEAQPAVSAALQAAGRGSRTVHRSVALNEFGEHFCRSCLPIGAADGEGVTRDRPPAPP
jgi:hypothetical protein